MRGPDELAWRVRIRAELDNLRAAVTWSLDAIDDADVELALRIIVGLAVQQGYDPTLGIGEWALRAHDRVESTTPARRQVVRAAAAYRTGVAGDYARARELALEALTDGQPADSPWPSGVAYTLGFIEMADGRHEVALEVLEAALEDLGDRIAPMDLMTLHAVAGSAASWGGDRTKAVMHGEQSLEFGRRAGSPSGIASSLFAYGVIMRTEDPAIARAALEEAIVLVRSGAVPVMYGHTLAVVARLRAQAGERAEALRALRDALQYAADTANEALAEQVRAEALPVLIEVGAPEVGATLLPESWLALSATSADVDAGGDLGAWFATLGAVRRELGDDEYDRARAHAAANVAAPDRRIRDRRVRPPDRGARRSWRSRVRCLNVLLR